MSRSDIIDDIDALIDEQLAAGETGQEQRARTADRRCWHCGRDWHGLAITKRLEEMRAEYRQRATPNIDDCGGRLVWHEITGPGGGYVHSREIVAASPHIDWFTTHNLTHLLPRRTRMRLALERFNVQMQAWQERLVEQFTEIGNTFRRATDRIEYSYREAFTNVADGMRIGVDVDGQVRTGIASNVEQRGDETTFDFTPDEQPWPIVNLANRATRRRTPPHQDPYWVQRADRRRGRQ